MRHLKTLQVAALCAALITACNERAPFVSLDSGVEADAGPLDASAANDAALDASAAYDAALEVDAAHDLGTSDSSVDSGVVDAAPLDAAAVDAELVDASVDTGGPDAEVCPVGFERDGHGGCTSMCPDPSPTLVWSQPMASGIRAKAVAFGDLDGDGIDELAIAHAESPGLVRIVRRGLSGWTVVQTLDEPTNDTFGLEWGDADDDGDADLVVASYSGGRVRVYRNVEGTLALAWTSDETLNFVTPKFGDYDGDGDLDVAVAVGSGGAARVYRNDGELQFVMAWTASIADHSVDVDWADLDLDGDLDLLVGMEGSVAVAAYENEGDDLFSLAWMLPLTGGGVGGYGVDAADIDGDGDADLALALFDVGVVLMRNQGAFVFEEAAASSACNPHRVAWGDWNGDDIPELAVSCEGAGARILTLDEHGGLASAWTSTETSSQGNVAWGRPMDAHFVSLATSTDNGVARVYDTGCRKADVAFGPFGTQVLSLTGASSGVQLPRNASFGDVGTAFTIEAWVRPDSATVDEYAVVFTRRAHLRDYAMTWSRGGDGRFRFEVYDDADVRTVALAPASSTPGQWHHVAGVVDGRDIRLYLNGERVASATAPNAITWLGDEPRATLHSEYGVFIGYTRSPGDSGSPSIGRFRGAIDDVRMSDVARYSGASFEFMTATTSDAATVGLWSFEEASGLTALDSGRTEALHGTLVGGATRARE